MPHQAKIVKVEAVADGVLMVKARCCSDPTTDSVLTIHKLEREDAAIDADVQNHLARVEKLHSDRDRAKAHIERLLST